MPSEKGLLVFTQYICQFIKTAYFMTLHMYLFWNAYYTTHEYIQEAVFFPLIQMLKHKKCKWY